MSFKNTKLLKVFILSGLLLFILSFETEGQQSYPFPPMPAPELYGNLLINRTSEKNNVKTVTFSHWIHREHHTCRVCHFELDFKFKINATEITEEDNRAGLFCGARTCHDGKAAFGHKDEKDCDKCHNGDISYGKEKFAAFKQKLPGAKYGNEINWIKAVERKLIKPMSVLDLAPPADLKYTKNLELVTTWFNIPPARFPHAKHSEWLDCNNCHPDFFAIKLGDTKDFKMGRIYKGELCGECHGKVAFHLKDCRRCHPKMTMQ